MGDKENRYASPIRAIKSTQNLADSSSSALSIHIFSFYLFVYFSQGFFKLLYSTEFPMSLLLPRVFLQIKKMKRMRATKKREIIWKWKEKITNGKIKNRNKTKRIFESVFHLMGFCFPPIDQRRDANICWIYLRAPTFFSLLSAFIIWFWIHKFIWYIGVEMVVLKRSPLKWHLNENVWYNTRLYYIQHWTDTLDWTTSSRFSFWIMRS